MHGFAINISYLTYVNCGWPRKAVLGPVCAQLLTCHCEAQSLGHSCGINVARLLGKCGSHEQYSMNTSKVDNQSFICCASRASHK